MHGLILRATRNMANVEIERAERIQGNSGYSFKKLLNLWMNGFTAFSEKPLRVASVVGCGFSFAGFFLHYSSLFGKFYTRESSLDIAVQWQLFWS